jgi:hypothetical protein
MSPLSSQIAMSLAHHSQVEHEHSRHFMLLANIMPSYHYDESMECYGKNPASSSQAE